MKKQQLSIPEAPISNLPVVRKKRVQKIQAVAITPTSIRIDALETEASIERTRAESYRDALRATTNQGRV